MSFLAFLGKKNKKGLALKELKGMTDFVGHPQSGHGAASLKIA
jgi:hypothetical protein